MTCEKYSCIDRTPYTYLIGWSSLNKWYYGVRFAKFCEPNDLCKKYFSSSVYVKRFIESHGLPDIVQIRKVFTDIDLARRWEQKVLLKISEANSKKELQKFWLNKCFNVLSPRTETRIITKR